jgi:ATP-binding protein involved in chromosome partitioning
MSPTDDQVRSALEGVEDPVLFRTLGELGLAGAVRVEGSRVEVTISLLTEEHPAIEELDDRILEAVAGLGGVEHVHVHHLILDEERVKLLVDQLHQQRITFADAGSKTRVLLISSGKGGVGKSSLTVNLSIALARLGRRVAVVDADVWGFSIPAMLGIDHPPVLVDNRMIIPPAAYGVTLASIGFFVAEDQPVVWRGPMLHKALEQFLSDFYWGDPDYLVVDMPPGTGDIAISLAGFLPTAEAYVVTTPQPAAQRVAQRAGLMFQSSQVKIPVRGVIENMSWFTGDDGTRYELFGHGGGEQLAERLDAPLIGQVPLVPELREGGDEGRPIMALDPDSEPGKAFTSIAEWIDDHKPTKRRNAALKIS